MPNAGGYVFAEAEKDDPSAVFGLLGPAAQATGVLSTLAVNYTANRRLTFRDSRQHVP